MVTKSAYSLSFVLALWGAIVALPAHSVLADGGPEGTPGVPVDLDGDGFTAVEGDLDDNDGSVYPGAPELEDGIDNDCDGIVDNGFEDLDEDGFPASEDCDDNNADIYPGAVEILGDGIDNDCDNSIEQTMSFSGILNGEDQWELLPLAWTQNLPQTLSFTIEVGGSAMSEPHYTIANGGATYWIDTESGFCRAYEQTASGLQLLYYYNATPSGQCSLVLNTAGQSPVELTILAHSAGFAAAYTIQWQY